ncbi:MAG: hypothetical protein JWN50_419 [Parcubacteria group bacterium]|nr:hypothetical protein [Parcubacteria group bacterium]
MNSQRIIAGVKNRFSRLSDRPYEWLLMNSRSEEKERFDAMQKDFMLSAERLCRADLGRFIDPLWKGMNETFLKEMKNGIPFNFLRHSLIGFTMFTQKSGKLMQSQIRILRRTFPEHVLKAVLREDPVGAPMIMQHSYLTSHNSIHLLSHVARFEETTGKSIASMDTIVEWGGGYGRLAVLVDRLKASKAYTYIIIDTPLFSSIQALYLSAVLGVGRVNFIDSAEKSIVSGKINILPLNFIEQCDAVKADLFMSTWALSESSPFAQKFVLERRMYSAEHVLVAFQDKNVNLPNAEGVREIARMSGAAVEDIPYLSQNHYIFK